jgi:hypothetical protein
MSVTSERHDSHGLTGEAHPHSACASCCESPAEHDHGREHGFEIVEVLRVVFVALAAAAVWFHLWEPFHRVSGHSSVEEATITGEPMPNEKIAGSAVYAGAINQTGTLETSA